MPHDCELLALPVITKDDRGNYVSATSGLTLADVIRLRAEILVGAARSFVPDVVIVDHVAVGVGGELRPMLSDLDGRSPRPAIVLGLRDIIDTDVTVEREWHALGVLPVLEDVYDRVLVYGDPSVLTTAQELRLPELLGDRLVFTGYLGDPDGSTATVADDRERPLIVVTAGGGGDGGSVIGAYGSSLRRLRDRRNEFRSMIVTGPLMSTRDQLKIRAVFSEFGPDVDVTRFTPGLSSVIAGADGVVSMAGYNTTVEIMSSAVPAYVMPRVKPRREQWIRAERLACRADITVASPDPDPGPGLDRFVERTIDRGPRSPTDVCLDGLTRVVSEIANLLIGPSPNPLRERTLSNVI